MPVSTINYMPDIPCACRYAEGDYYKNMRSTGVVNELPKFIPAFLDISELSHPSTLRVLGGLQKRNATDIDVSLAKLRELPNFERTAEARVIPRDELNAHPRMDNRFHIMDVHAGIRQSLSHGVGGLVEIARERDSLRARDTWRAGHLIKEFGGFAVVRATQLDQMGWRRSNGYSGNDGEGQYIAKHYRSYEALKPFMSAQFKRIVREAAARHEWLAELSSTPDIELEGLHQL
jgi:hypothetical protein